MEILKTNIFESLASNLPAHSKAYMPYVTTRVMTESFTAYGGAAPPIDWGGSHLSAWEESGECGGGGGGCRGHTNVLLLGSFAPGKVSVKRH